MNTQAPKKRSDVLHVISKDLLYQTFFECAKDAIFILDGEFFIECNQKTVEMFCTSKESIIGTSPYFYSPPFQPDGRSSEEKAKEKIDAALSGVPQQFEWTHQRSTGEMFETNVFLVRIVIDNCVLLQATVRDITDQKKYEQQSRQREETFRALTENAVDVIMRFDSECRHLYVNLIAEVQTGISPNQFIGKTHSELGFPKDLCDIWEGAIRKTFALKVVQRIEFQLPNGNWLDWMLVPEFDQSGNVLAVLTSARDITSRKKAEKDHAQLQTQLQQAMKMEAIGRLVGGITHDFNNALTGIMGNVELALMDTLPTEQIFENLVEIRKAAEHATNLTRQLLTFSHKQIIAPKLINVNDRISNLSKMLVRLIGENIELQTILGANIQSIVIDPGQFEQILVNLIVNARDAISENGTISIKTENIVIDATFCESHPSISIGNYVLISVADNGCGMSEEVKKHLFEPFFSTKPVGKGTGLGLAIAHNIVAQSKGIVDVESEIGNGTMFKLYFPSIQEEAPLASSEITDGYLRIGKETILLVEDDDGIRELVSKFLCRLGYTVLIARDGKTALEIAEQHAHKIDMLLTDIVMPGMNGIKLAEKICQFNNHIKVLYSSGYIENAIFDKEKLQYSVNFIEKPYTMQKLAQKVHMTLKSRRSKIE